MGQSPLKWPGSKTRLASVIYNRFPPHTHYVEVFGGSGAVLFAKPRSRIETFNDLDGDVVNLMRVIRDTPDPLIRAVSLTPYSRAEHESARTQIGSADPADDLDVDRARQFLVAVNQSVARSTSGTGWAAAVRDHGGSTGVDRWMRLPDRIAAAVTRLTGVQIDRTDWEQLIDRVDRPETALYLDPPYVPSERAVNYRTEMSVEDHARLVNRLIGLADADAVVSGYDHPIYDPLLDAGWERTEIEAFADGPGQWAKRARVEVLWLSPGCSTTTGARLF